MRLIVDTNIIISALIRDSVTRKMLTHSKHELLTINFSKKELQKYEKEIMKKANVNKEELYTILNNILEHIIILDDKLIKLKMKEAKEIMHLIDGDDAPFIAAALVTKSSIWSDDEHFQKQDKIKVYMKNSRT